MGLGVVCGQAVALCALGRTSEALERVLSRTRGGHGDPSSLPASTVSALLHVAVESLTQLDTVTAMHSLRSLGDASSVVELMRLANIEDTHLLRGEVCLLLGKGSLARDAFMGSAEPRRALEARRDVMDWEGALELAKAVGKDGT